MTDKELWRQMENIASKEQSLERDTAFMLLLKTAYDKDMKLIMSCVYDKMMPGMVRIKALLLDDIDAMNEYMNRVSASVFSSFDTGIRPSGKDHFQNILCNSIVI